MLNTSLEHLAEVKEFYAKWKETILPLQPQRDLFQKIESLLLGYEQMFMLSPFQVGDRVQLKKTPEISPSTAWGWLGAKHFLIAGAKAEVKAIDWDKTHKEFAYYLQFDDCSYINSHTKEMISIPEGDRGVYYFRSGWVEEIRDDQEHLSPVC